MKSLANTINEAKDKPEVKLYKEIGTAINKIDNIMSYKTVASAVAILLKENYGTHNFEPFVKELKTKLNLK